jgi:hypothetical protein
MSDLLLEWMSYRRTGKKDDLLSHLLAGEAAAWMLADLAALGHADIGTDGTWRIAPPVLAVIGEERGAAQAVLCGARTPKLLERFRAGCISARGTLSETPQDGRPSTVTVSAQDRTSLASIAAATGIAFHLDAPFTLLACLPAIRDWPRTPCAMVAGRVSSVKRFSRSHRSWVPSSLEEASKAHRGLFRIRRDWDWVNLLKQGPDRQAQIDIYAGRIAAAEGAKVVDWDPPAASFRLPMSLSPPTLIARGLVLCSGLLPLRDRNSRTLAYQQVPLRIARLALALTGLRFA